MRPVALDVSMPSLRDLRTMFPVPGRPESWPSPRRRSGQAGRFQSRRLRRRDDTWVGTFGVKDGERRCVDEEHGAGSDVDDDAPAYSIAERLLQGRYDDDQSQQAEWP